MNHSSTRITYDSTGYFSRIVSDYITTAPTLRPFYLHTPSIDGIREAIVRRKAFQTPRKALQEALQQQYQQVELHPAAQANLDALVHENTFTVVTAHQPNIFTGPLYFIYKILHTIRLTRELAAQMPDERFVPVYYMGSEDADLDELGTISVGGEKLRWETTQTGAVGRMLVDKALLQVLERIAGQAGVLPFGKELVQLLRDAYVPGRSIQEATLKLVNDLFGRFGLLVVIPDNALLKQQFNQVVRRELLEGFSHKAVQQTIVELGKTYKVQAGGREINLFYLLDDKRERIEKEGDAYTVKPLDLHFTQEQILDELDAHPERFSANVILRGAFQETILPNIAFIGGGGELAYWLELQQVFQAIEVPYPVLVLRNSFLLMQAEEQQRMQKLGIDLVQLFKPAQQLHTEWVLAKTATPVQLTDALAQFDQLYAAIGQQAGSVDASLKEHVSALTVQARKKLVELEKKMLRAEKRKFAVEEQQIRSLKDNLFPGNSLQERTDNFSLWYARWGQEWLDMLLEHSPAMESEFTVIVVA